MPNPIAVATKSCVIIFYLYLQPHKGTSATQHARLWQLAVTDPSAPQRYVCNPVQKPSQKAALYRLQLAVSVDRGVYGNTFFLRSSDGRGAPSCNALGYSLLRLGGSFRPRERAAAWFVISGHRYRVLRWANHCSYSTTRAAAAVYAALLSGATVALSRPITSHCTGSGLRAGRAGGRA